jgi:anion-transporting  ArsA/GET3 family ATPase
VASTPELFLVTGKGGVGKTTISVALAIAFANVGKRVLLVDVEQSGAVAKFLDQEPLHFAPKIVKDNWSSASGQLWAMSLSTLDSLDEYVRIHLKLPAVAKIPQISRIFEFVATAAPGVRELLTVGKLAYEVREHNYDVVIADCAASGHGLGQLEAVRAVHTLAVNGPIRSQTGWMIDILSDPVRTRALVVTTAEELPVTETLELIDNLGTRTDVPVGYVVANRVFPARLTTGQHEQIPHTEEFSDLLLSEALRATQLASLSELTSRLSQLADGPTYLSIPEYFVDHVDREILNKIANDLTIELDIAP